LKYRDQACNQDAMHRQGAKKSQRLVKASVVPRAKVMG
jgi:hypothetical protein